MKRRCEIFKRCENYSLKSYLFSPNSSSATSRALIVSSLEAFIGTSLFDALRTSGPCLKGISFPIMTPLGNVFPDNLIDVMLES